MPKKQKYPPPLIVVSREEKEAHESGRHTRERPSPYSRGSPLDRGHSRNNSLTTPSSRRHSRQNSFDESSTPLKPLSVRRDVRFLDGGDTASDVGAGIGEGAGRGHKVVVSSRKKRHKERESERHKNKEDLMVVDEEEKKSTPTPTSASSRGSLATTTPSGTRNCVKGPRTIVVASKKRVESEEDSDEDEEEKHRSIRHHSLRSRPSSKGDDDADTVVPVRRSKRIASQSHVEAATPTAAALTPASKLSQSFALLECGTSGVRVAKPPPELAFLKLPVEGYLRKFKKSRVGRMLGSGRTTSERWCRLEHNRFLYCKQGPSTPFKSLALSSVSGVSLHARRLDSFVLSTPRRSYKLQAQNEEDCQYWVKAVELALANLSKSANPSGLNTTV